MYNVSRQFRLLSHPGPRFWITVAFRRVTRALAVSLLFGLSLLVGLVLVLIGINLPWVGRILRLLVILIGLGMLTEAIRTAWRNRGSSVYAA